MHPKQYITTVLALIACVAYAAHAADKHGHDHDHRPLHGGIVAEAGDLNYELVARPDSLTIYVTDHGKPVAATGARGTATVHSANEKTTAVLEPAGENKLSAKGSCKQGDGGRAAATVALAGKPEAKLNFRLK